jgi:Flp pilus assembly protein TadG
MRCLRRNANRRRGKFLVVSSLLLPVLLGGMALSVDYGVLCVAHGQLRNAADAAALAGARRLVTEARLANRSDLTAESSAARSQSVTVAQANPVRNQTVPVSGSDVAIGYVDPVRPDIGFTTAGSPALSNAVAVTLGCSVDRGNAIPTFFAGVLGRSNPTTNVRSVALAAQYTITGFRSVPGRNVHVLPIALDAATYDAMIVSNAGIVRATTDSYRYDPATGTVSAGADGVYESQMYPVATGSPGNWGTVKIGVSNNSTSVLSDQIQYGLTPAQLATYPGGVLQLDPVTRSLTLEGNPGISAGIQSALTSIIGRTSVVPVYSSVQGNGNNTRYTITTFAAVRVLAVNFQGSPKYVVVQPATFQDPTVISGAPKQGWTSGGVLGIRLVE